MARQVCREIKIQRIHARQNLCCVISLQAKFKKGYVNNLSAKPPDLCCLNHIGNDKRKNGNDKTIHEYIIGDFDIPVSPEQNNSLVVDVS
jgi:hypothetical protein